MRGDTVRSRERDPLHGVSFSSCCPTGGGTCRAVMAQMIVEAVFDPDQDVLATLQRTACTRMPRHTFVQRGSSLIRRILLSEQHLNLASQIGHRISARTGGETSLGLERNGVVRWTTDVRICS